MTISPPAALLGSQTPTHRHVPPRVHSAGQEATELAASAGLILDPWQRSVLEDALGEKADGKWAASTVGLIVPRQNGKGSILEAKTLHALYLSPSRLILWSAQDFKTATEGFLRVKALIDNTDDLRKRVDRVRTSHGEEGIELRDGTRLRFVARSRSSGRGFSPDDVILDEAYALSGPAVAALLPTLSARPNPQVWYTSSAPLPESEVLRRLCIRGRSGEASAMAYMEWCADSNANPDDPRAIAQANPALGRRLSLDFTASERASMGDEEFLRERLGIWRECDTVSVIPAHEWDALADPESAPLGPVVLALDVTPSRSSASLAVAGMREDNRHHVEVIDNRAGTGWLVERVAEFVKRWSPLAVIVDDKGPAGSFLGELDRAGVQVTVPTTRDVAGAAARLFDACKPENATLRHMGQPVLDAALSGAITRPLGDAWTWDRRKPTTDISPLVAVTLALWGFEMFGQNTGPSVW